MPASYKEVVAKWNWLQKYITESNETPNAKQFRESSFNLYINEQYSASNIDYIIAPFTKILRLRER
jgi:perosamine synthetase